MNRLFSALLSAAAIVSFTTASAQVQFGIKVGGNYLIASQSISPEPKDALPTPKGLGLQFGAYAKIPFSDLVGLRPELSFSFRRAKFDKSTTENYNNQQFNEGVFNGSITLDQKTDQHLAYFQIVAPLTLNPSTNFRVLFGPAIGFLMGGKLNEEVTQTNKGTLNNQPVSETPTLTATDKKGSAAIKDFKKAEVAVVGGVGYELDMGLDFELRYYRAIVPTQDITETNLRYKAFTNMVELSIGFTFGN